MSLFGGPKKSSYLGVDIGSHSVKVVELANEKGRAKLMTYGYSERKPGEGGVPLLDDPKAAGNLLAVVCKKAGATSTRAVAAIPVSNLFSTIIAVPRRGTEKELKPLIDSQIAKLSPLPIAEMVTYSTFIDEMGKKKGEQGTRGQGTGNKDALQAKKPSEYVRVLVTGGAKSLIQKYIEIFRVAKLELLSIDAEPFALIRSLVGKDKMPMAIVDIGDSRTNITIVEKGIPFLTRSINLGGSAVTKRITEQMGVPEDQAIQIKADLGALAVGTVQGGLPKVLEGVMQPIVNEIRYAFQLYANMELTDMKKVEKVIVTGGSSHLPHVPEYFSEMLNLNVYRGDPWARVMYPTDLRPVLDEIGPRLSVAIGLAMRDIE